MVVSISCPTAETTGLRHPAAALAYSLNPYGVLARGYAVATSGEDVVPVEELRPGQQFVLRGAKAEADCTVQSVRETEQGGNGNEAAEII